VADGHVIQEHDWKMSDVPCQSDEPVGYKRPHYCIRVEGSWFDVPPDAVISDGAECGPEPDEASRSLPHAWYSMHRNEDSKLIDLVLYCFMAGTEY